MGWKPLLWATSLFLLMRVATTAQLRQGLNVLKIKIRFLELLRIQLISNFYNLVLPGDFAGGAVLWYRIFRKSARVYETGLVVGFFRLLNTFTLILLGAAAAAFDSSLVDTRMRQITLVSLILTALLMFPLFSGRALTSIKHLLHPLLNRLPTRPATIVMKAGRAARFFVSTHTASSIGLALLLSFAHHLIGVYWMFGLARAFGLDVSIFVVGWLRTLIALLQMIPITVAGLGTREVGMVYLLGAYSVSQPLALAYSLGVFTVNLLGSMTGGICEAWAPARTTKQPHE